MIAARQAAASKAVEKGVTGKERLFQQNRNFGPGPIKPYPGPGMNKPPLPGAENRRQIPSGRGYKPKPIPSGGNPNARKGTGDREYGPTYRRPGEQTV